MTSRERRDDSGLLRSYSFSWDGDNRLRSVNEGATNRFTASYDGSGTRISKTDSWTGAHNYSWGPGGLLYDSSGNTTYTPGLSQQANGTDRYPLHDWLGSTRYLTDGSQSVKSALRFDAYGNRSLTGGTDAYDPSDFQFGAGWSYQTEYANGVAEPGLGLQLLGERYYDPAVGRFISQDPLGLADYSYAGNDPVNAVDPSGLYSIAEWASDFEAGREVVGEFEYNNRYWLGPVAGVSAGLLTANPYVGAAVGGFVSGRAAAVGGEDWPHVLADAGAGATGAHAFGQLLDHSLLAFQYLSGGEEAEVECSGPIAPQLNGTQSSFPAGLRSGGMLPNLIGNRGRALTEAEIIRQGGRILGEEITLDTPSGVRTRLDFVYETAQGELRFAESKMGRYARFTENQRVGIPSVEAGGAIPRGLNAENAGLPVGHALGATPVDVFWWD